MKFESNYTINFDEIEKVKDLDIEIQASGFIKKELKNAGNSPYYFSTKNILILTKNSWIGHLRWSSKRKRLRKRR